MTSTSRAPTTRTWPSGSASTTASAPDLARTEAVSTFTLLAQEMLATMRIDGPRPWKEHHIVRGLEALPVAW